MSLLSDAVRAASTTPCAACGAVIRKRDALIEDGLAFCSVLEQAEWFVATHE